MFRNYKYIIFLDKNKIPETAVLILTLQSASPFFVSTNVADLETIYGGMYVLSLILKREHALEVSRNKLHKTYTTPQCNIYNTVHHFSLSEAIHTL
jgi:hypothetical protein